MKFGCFCYQENMFQFVVEKCELRLSDDGEEKLKNCLRVYCVNISRRWQKCNRVYRIFILKYNVWLQKEFTIPVENLSEIISTAYPSTSDNKFPVTPPLKRRAFSDVTDRHKRNE